MESLQLEVTAMPECVTLTGLRPLAVPHRPERRTTGWARAMPDHGSDPAAYRRYHSAATLPRRRGVNSTEILNGSFGADWS